MKVISVVSQPLYAAIGIVSALLMSVVYLYSQVLGNLHNIDIWIKIIPWYNALLFVEFVVLLLRSGKTPEPIMLSIASTNKHSRHYRVNCAMPAISWLQRMPICCN